MDSTFIQCFFYYEALGNFVRCFNSFKNVECISTPTAFNTSKGKEIINFPVFGKMNFVEETTENNPIKFNFRIGSELVKRTAEFDPICVAIFTASHQEATQFPIN